MEGSNPLGKPNLAATSWALLGMLSYEHELSGYDIRKWIDWSMRFYYGSPAYSQIYSELKKLEQLGLVTSRVENAGGTRNSRLYKISDAGLDEVHHKAAKDARWAGADPSWAYARVALQWAERYYANERELALKMIKELDEAEAAFPQPGKGGPTKIPWPTPEFWYEIEKKADAEEPG